MSDALTNRDLRGVLKIYIHVTQLTQEALANLINTNQGNISKILGGQRRRYSIKEFESLRDGLHIPGPLLGLQPHPQPTEDPYQGEPEGYTHSTQGDVSGIPSGTLGRSPTPDQGDDDMERRSLLQLTMLGISAGALGSTGESARQLLALALNDEPRDVDDWHLTLSDHLHALRTRSPAQVSKDMMVDLIAIKYQSRTAKAEDKTELQRVTAGLSILHANALTRLGDHGAAIQWERTARMTADASGDLNLRLMVRCEEAGYGLYGQRDLTTVLQLIEAAEHLAGDTPSFWHADLAGSRAKAMSLLGRHDEAKKALNTFVGYEGKDARAGIIPALWTMSQAHFAESWVYAHEGNESEAGRAREIVVARTRDYQYTANVQLHEALCTVVNGGADHGTTRATEILTALPPTQQSQMIIETGKAVLRAVPVEKRDRPAVRELHAALTSGQNRTALT